MESQSHCTIALSVIVIQQGIAWSGLGVASERIGVQITLTQIKKYGISQFFW